MAEKLATLEDDLQALGLMDEAKNLAKSTEDEAHGEEPADELDEIKVKRIKRTPRRMLMKRKRSYRKRKARLKVMSRRAARRPKAKRRRKRISMIRKRRHLGARRRIQLGGLDKTGKIMESLDVINQVLHGSDEEHMFKLLENLDTVAGLLGKRLQEMQNAYCQDKQVGGEPADYPSGYRKGDAEPYKAQNEMDGETDTGGEDDDLDNADDLELEDDDLEDDEPADDEADGDDDLGEASDGEEEDGEEEEDDMDEQLENLKQIREEVSVLHDKMKKHVIKPEDAEDLIREIVQMLGGMIKNFAMMHGVAHGYDSGLAGEKNGDDVNGASDDADMEMGEEGDEEGLEDDDELSDEDLAELEDDEDMEEEDGEEEEELDDDGEDGEDEPEEMEESKKKQRKTQLTT